jgi:hypothetical protein
MGPPEREAGSLLCGDIRTEQGASPCRRKVIADDVHDTVIMVTAGH